MPLIIDEEGRLTPSLVVGANVVWATAAGGTNRLLLEDGFYLLMENGDFIQLEQ